MAASPIREPDVEKCEKENPQAELLRQDSRCQPDAKREKSPPQGEDMRQDAQCPPPSDCGCDD